MTRLEKLEQNIKTLQRDLKCCKREEVICLNTATPAFAPEDILNPTTDEVQAWVEANLTTCQQNGGTHISYFLPAYNEDTEINLEVTVDPLAETIITSFIVNGDELIVDPITVIDSDPLFVYTDELAVLFAAWLLLHPEVEATFDDTDLVNGNITITDIFSDLTVTIGYTYDGDPLETTDTVLMTEAVGTCEDPLFVWVLSQDGNITRVEYFSEAFIVDRFNDNILGIDVYNPGLPLANWTAPAAPTLGNTVTVKFTDGTIVTYTYNGVAWVVDFTDEWFEERICLNTSTPTLVPANPSLPTHAEVQAWAIANLTIKQRQNGTNLVWFITGDGGDCDNPDYTWTLNKGSQLVSRNQNTIITIPNYTSLRTLTKYNHDIVNVADFTYIGPDGNSYTTLGGVFRKVSSGTENGGTIIVATDTTIWERDWDKIHVQPEWWECGGYDYKGDLYTDKNIDGTVTAVPKGTYNDRDRVQSAIQVGGRGSVIVFEKDKEYEIDIYLELIVGQTLQGNNCTIKRIDTPTSLVSANSLSGVTSVTLTDASSFRVGQIIMFTILSAPEGGIAYNENVGIIDAHRITDITGNVVTFTNALTANVNIGYRAITTTNLFGSSSGSALELYTIKNINFDGNKTGNPYCNDWRYGASIYLPNTEEQTIIENCYFHDTPAENIFSGACKLLNSKYSELNGSLIHFSADINREATTVVDKCYGVGSNRATNAIMSHSEALITSSYNTTNIRITNCNFKDGEEAVITATTYRDFDYSIENNNFEDFKYVIVVGAGENQTSRKNIRINNNTYYNCGPIYVSSSSSMFEGFGADLITINNNTFVNTRIEMQDVSRISILDNKFYWDNGLSTKYDYSTNTLNGQNSFNHFIYFDRLHIIGNTFEYPNVYNSETQYGLHIQHNNIVRKTSVGVDTEYLYSQDVKVNGNTFAGFKFTITTVNTTGPQYVNLILQAVGWEYKNNIIYCSRTSGANGGTGIFVDPGVVCEGNTIYTNAVAPLYAGIIAAGVGTAGNAHNRLIGAICINNKILGCSAATAADIVANADGTRYNVTCLYNMTRDDVANATNGYFAGNYKLTTALYTALSAMTCPEWRYFSEDANQY